jgi:hypothetical protein
MAVERKDIEIFFKIEGLEAYITDLETLDSVLKQVDNATSKAKESTKELEQVTEDFDNFEKQLNAAEGGVKTLAGSFEFLAGAVGLLGADENPFFKEISENVINVLALSRGAIDASEGMKLLAQNSALAQKAQKLLNIETLKNPYVALAAGVLAVAGALLVLVNNSKNAQKQAEELRRQYELQQAALDKTGSALIRLIENENQLNNLRKSVTGQTQQQLLRNQERLNDALETEGDRVRIAQERYIEVSNLNKQGRVGLKNVEEALAAFQAAQKQATDNSKFYSDQLAIVNAELDKRSSKTDNNTSSTKNNTDAIDKQNEALRAQQELLAEQNKYLDSLAVLEEELYEAGLSQRDKERKDLEDQYYERLNILDLNRLAVLESKVIEGKQLTETELADLQELNRLKLLVETQYQKDKQTLEGKFLQEDIDAATQRNTTIRAILDGFAAKEVEDEIQRQQDALDRQYIAEFEKLKLAGATFEDLLELQKKYEDASVDLTKKGEQKKKEAQLKTFADSIDLAAQSFDALVNLSNAFSKINEDSSEEDRKREFERQKRFQVGQAIIATAAAVTQQLAVPKDALTGANFVKAGIALATGIAQIATIRKTQYQSSGGDGGGEIPTPALPTGTNDPGGAIAPGETSAGSPSGGTEPPIRAYVLVSDVNSAQQANQQIENLAKL